MPRVIVVQPAVPSYRIDFFSRLRAKCGLDFAVYSSWVELGGLTSRSEKSEWEERLPALNWVAKKFYWQPRVLSIRVRRGDTIVVCGEPRGLSNIALLIRAKLAGAHTIWWGHYWSSTSKAWRATIRLQLMRLADALLFYTDQEVEEYRARHGDRPMHVAALNNGLMTSDIVRLRDPYDPVARPRDLVFLGRLTEKAELGLLIEAMARPACGRVTLDVLGSGDQEPALRKLAADLGVTERIRWHGGTVDETLIARVVNQCKVNVYPGGVGLSLIHGFAYGLPALVHDDRWKHMPEIAALQPGQNGVVFKRNDADSLAQTIASMLSDNVQLSSMSDAAKGTVERSFNTEDMADRFVTLVSALQSKQKDP